MKKINRFHFKRFCVIFIGLLPLIALGQEHGINFESNLSWQQILEKAKRENKYIFVDCYATWCGPCKWMSKNIFPKKEVADYFNAHFINISVQMDRTPNDNQFVKDWYDEAEKLVKSYEINAYPTYLFFNPNGIPVHRAVGSINDPKKFVSLGEDAFNPEKQYYILLQSLPEHLGDSSFLSHAFENAVNSSDKENAIIFGEAYMKSIKDPFAKENIEAAGQLLDLENYSNNAWFNFLNNNSSEINRIMGDEQFVQWKLVWVITNEEIAPLFKNNKFPLHWDSISNLLRSKYPKLGEGLITVIGFQFRNFIISRIRNEVDSVRGNETKNWDHIIKLTEKEILGFDLGQILLEEEARYWSIKQNWTMCGKASFALMRKYGEKLGSRETNHISWYYLFEHCNDRRILNEGLAWMRHYLDLEPKRDENLDTYANLLYKEGNSKEAIIWEKRAIAAAEGNKDPNSADYIKQYENALEKMEQGSPTWGL